jgi:hypothetical protein
VALVREPVAPEEPSVRFSNDSSGQLPHTDPAQRLVKTRACRSEVAGGSKFTSL